MRSLLSEADDLAIQTLALKEKVVFEYYAHPLPLSLCFRSRDRVRLQVDHARCEREQAEPRLAAIEEQLATAQAELSEREKEASE